MANPDSFFIYENKYINNSLNYKVTYFLKAIIIVYLFLIIFLIYSNRFLYADGCSFFLEIIKNSDFTKLDSSRQFAHYITQLPLVAAITLFNVTNLKVLSFIFGATLFIHQIISLILIYLIVGKNNINYIIFPLISFIYLSFNTSFYIISEIQLAQSFFWPILFFLLVYDKINLSHSIILILSSFLTIRIYESFLFFGSLLIFVALLRILFFIKRKNIFEILVYTVIIIFFIIGISISVYSTIFPRDIINRDRLLLLILKPFFLKNVIVIVSSIMFMFLLSEFFVKNKSLVAKIIRISIYLILGLFIGTVPFISPLSIHPSHNYFARILSIIIPIFLTLVLLFFNYFRYAWDNKKLKVIWLFVAIFTMSNISYQVGATIEWINYKNVFISELMEKKGIVEFQNSKLSKSYINNNTVYQFNFFPYMPAMSIVLSAIEFKEVKTIIKNPNLNVWQPFDPEQIHQLPNLHQYGITYNLN